MAELMTTSLRLELDKTNQMFNRWADEKIDWLESTSSEYERTKEECDCTLKALKDTEAELEMLREHNDQIKKEQDDEVQAYMQQTEKLKELEKKLIPNIRVLEDEHEKENQRLEEVRKDYDQAKSQAARSIDDLTHGIKMYSYLGLEFQKADGDCMKFIFTLLDARDPSKQFFFLMFVDGDDKYQLVDTSPLLDASVCSKHLEALNSDNDISKFVVKMRAEFKKLC